MPRKRAPGKPAVAATAGLSALGAELGSIDDFLQRVARNPTTFLRTCARLPPLPRRQLPTLLSPRRAPELRCENSGLAWPCPSAPHSRASGHAAFNVALPPPPAARRPHSATTSSASLAQQCQDAVKLLYDLGASAPILRLTLLHALVSPPAPLHPCERRATALARHSRVPRLVVAWANRFRQDLGVASQFGRLLPSRSTQKRAAARGA